MVYKNSVVGLNLWESMVMRSFVIYCGGEQKRHSTMFKLGSLLLNLNSFLYLTGINTIL